MKLLHVGMGWFPEEAGGLSRYMSQAVVAQSRASHVVKGLVTGSSRVVSLSGGLAVPFSPPDAPLPERLTSLRRSFRSLLLQHDPELVAFHFALYGRPVLGQVKNRPWMMHFHGPWASEGAAEGASRWSTWMKQRFVEAPLYRGAPRVVTLSKCFSGILQDQFGVDPERIRVVPGGFDPTNFLAAPDRERARQHLGLPLDRPILACVRRLANRMGLENLLEAVARLRATHPDILLLIAGKGPIRATLESRIEALCISGNVQLLGFVPDEDLPYLYAAANLSVVPTVSLEGFGLIVAESLASGTPVVASRVGALPELFEGFHQDLLADPDPESLADVLSRNLSPEGNPPGPEACRDHSMRWSWSRVTPVLEGIYKDVIEIRGGPKAR